MNSNFRNFALWVIIALLLIALFNLFQSPSQRTTASEISYSQLLTDVEDGRVRSVTISGQQISGQYTDGRVFQTFAPENSGLVPLLQENGVAINARPASEDVAIRSF